MGCGWVLRWDSARIYSGSFRGFEGLQQFRKGEGLGCRGRGLDLHFGT